jgi:AraC-like DNA-binding protein
MYVNRLPRSFPPEKAIVPPVYTDHLLFAEELEQPYSYPEQPSGIGLLTTLAGTCNYHINGSRQHIDRSKVFFINRGSTLAVKATGNECAPTMLFFNSRLPDLIQHSLNYGHELLLDEPFNNLPYDFSYLERIHAQTDLSNVIQTLLELGSSCSSFAALKADMMIRALLEDLLKQNQEAYRQSQNIQAVKASTRLEIFKRISLARDWMEQHYQTALSLDAIAAVANMNSQHFLRMFRQVYLITPHQYLIELKLTKARHLLETTQTPINDVCRAIGFESVFSFSVLFKNRFGLAPSHFRKAG